MDAAATIRMERLNYVFGAIAIGITAVLGTRDQLIGMAVGAGISCLNFSILRRLVGRVVSTEGKGKNVAAMLFLPQMLGLMGAVSLALWYLPASPVFLAIGFSVFMVSIAVETARFFMSPVIGH
jgi:hypothetical protein